MKKDDHLTISEADDRLVGKLVGQPLTEQAIRAVHEADRQAQVSSAYEPNRIPFHQVRVGEESLRFVVQLLKNRSARPKEPQDGCPLDLDGIKQKGRQHWLTFNLLGRMMAVLANPFAFFCWHTTIASVLHEPQFWRSGTAEGTRQKIVRAVRDLYVLARQLPSFVLIFNASRESGASLPFHQHYQLFQLPPGFGTLAIQQAAAKRPPAPVIQLGFANDYPVCAVRFTGDEADVVAAAADFLAGWDDTLPEAATANLIAATENGQVALYVVLRNALFRHAQGFEGILGSAEMAGLVILSAEYEFQAVQDRKFTFTSVWEMIGAVCPPEARLMR